MPEPTYINVTVSESDPVVIGVTEVVIANSPIPAVPAYLSAPSPGGFAEGSLIYVVSENALQLLYQGAWITLGGGGSSPGTTYATYDVSFYDTDYYA